MGGASRERGHRRLRSRYLMAFSLVAISVPSLGDSGQHPAPPARAQQRVQTMVARDKPLASTLQAICRMVEAQSPGALSSIISATAKGSVWMRSTASACPVPFSRQCRGCLSPPMRVPAVRGLSTRFRDLRRHRQRRPLARFP
ncbi:hypothetical protein DSL92_05260 [Billgrantia gudaonensis]|uniref:Uncharacterized protein n=1 Tax=Billgrantia gudaonensis TaxID=376427 RepID=A0A432JJ04_9GAMM|nr:hypothetical protein DSL92_05260 [Halomonas gudaonensis]